MEWTVGQVGARSSLRDPLEPSIQLYLDRCSPIAKCRTETFKSEAGLFEWMDRRSGRTSVVPVLLDSRGRSLTSEAFAAWLDARRLDGSQHVLFAVGPADGWSPEGRERAKLLLSLGSFTLAHTLARLVLAEQLYRATAILTRHPYHGGH
jgi:23S rRNA (pseudouridine1915-N3)-methyltransferase